jgi:hypothetical protein
VPGPVCALSISAWARGRFDSGGVLGPTGVVLNPVEAL